MLNIVTSHLSKMLGWGLIFLMLPLLLWSYRCNEAVDGAGIARLPIMKIPAVDVPRRLKAKPEVPVLTPEGVKNVPVKDAEQVVATVRVDSLSLVIRERKKPTFFPVLREHFGAYRPVGIAALHASGRLPDVDVMMPRPPLVSSDWTWHAGYGGRHQSQGLFLAISPLHVGGVSIGSFALISTSLGQSGAGLQGGVEVLDRVMVHTAYDLVHRQPVIGLSYRF